MKMSSGLLIYLAVAAFSWANPITSIVAYGDSYSDNGNLGRESNGPVIVEQLAANLKVPLIDHAWVGATTGIGNLSDGGGLTQLGTRGDPGMTTSVNADLLNPLPGDITSTLFVVWGGHNDILVNGQNQAVTNIVAIVNSLEAAGATHILVPGVMDLGLTPFGNRPGVSAQFTATSKTLNAQLSVLLPSNVVYINMASILESIVSDPGTYGLSNVTAACSFSASCTHPDQYLFWDSFHPTTSADAIFAADFQAAVEAVPEPSCFLMTGAGGSLIFGVARLSRRRRRCFTLLYQGPLENSGNALLPHRTRSGR